MTPRATPYPGAERFLPERRTLPALREAAAGCRGCPLYRDATQTVFGAGRLLDEALAGAGLDWFEVYITNVVKHFKFVTRGGRRFHKTPTRAEVQACRAWIESELDAARVSRGGDDSPSRGAPAAYLGRPAARAHATDRRPQAGGRAVREARGYFGGGLCQRTWMIIQRPFSLASRR